MQSKREALGCGPPMRAGSSLVCLLLGCARAVDPRAEPDDERPVDVTPAAPPMAADALASLQTTAVGRGELYWRVRGPDGPRCEAWSFEPAIDDPSRGRLVRAEGPLRFSFAYRIADGLLRLSAPLREREVATAAGRLRKTTGLALPCIFTGASLTPADPAAPRRLVLEGNERWFLDAGACDAAGLEPAVGELRPVGCAPALADPGTRALAEATATTSPAATRLRAGERVFWLRRRGDRSVCEAWSHEPGEPPGHGLLRRRGRDEHGRRSVVYGYAVAGDALTLLGPNEFRRARDRRGVVEVVRASGCLITRPLALAGDVLRFGADRWYLRRGACERDRVAGLAAQPDPDCAQN